MEILAPYINRNKPGNTPATATPFLNIQETDTGLEVKEPRRGGRPTRHWGLVPGLCLIAAAICLFLLPSTIFGAGAALVQMIAAGCAALCGVLLLSVRTLVGRNEITLDTNLRSVRHLRYDPRGNSSKTLNIPFSQISGIFVEDDGFEEHSSDPKDRVALARLIMRFERRPYRRVVLRGRAEQITLLRDLFLSICLDEAEG